MKKHAALSYVLLLLVKICNTARQPCAPGEYNDGGGACLPCFPCPRQDLSKWVEKDCVDAFVDCPNLCRLPNVEWTKNNLADESICNNLNLNRAITTTIKVTTLADVTTAIEEVTAKKLDTTEPIAEDSPSYKTAAKSEKGEGRGISPEMTTTIIATSLIIVIIIGVVMTFMCKFYITRREKSERDSKSAQLLKSKAKLGYFSDERSIKFRRGCHGADYVVLMLDQKKIASKPIDKKGTEFNLSDGLLPNMKYTAKFCKKSDEESGGEKIIKIIPVSTEALTFQAVLQEGSVVFQDIDDVLKFQVLYESCSCIGNGQKQLLSTDKSFTLNGFQWRSIQIALYMKNGNTDHLVGEDQVKNKGSDLKLPPCSYKLADCNPRDLHELFNPQDPELLKFCMHVIVACNKLSQKDIFEGFLDENRIKTLSSSDFCSEFFPIFSWEDLSKITLHDLLNSIMNKMSCQKFKTQITRLCEIFLKYHEGCARCMTLIHHIMHEADYRDEEEESSSSFSDSSSVSSEISSSPNNSSSVSISSSPQRTSIDEEEDICNSGTNLLSQKMTQV